MAKARWQKTLVAESDEIIEVEGNVYFPPESVNKSFLQSSNTQTVCPWKGTAHYYDIRVEDDINKDAAWYYPETKEKAKKIEGYIAFWKGVEIEK